jgi:Ser/Thr protein kinase RdoA (MazF antagonist)
MLDLSIVETDIPVRPVHSIVDPSALGELIERHYGLPVRSAVLLRSLINELYRIESDDRCYAAKLYRTDDADRARARLGWEAALADHLRRAGHLGVPAILRSTAGDRLITIAAPEGPRMLIISDWVTGSKPTPPYDDALYEGFGRLVAGFHAATEDFPDSPNAPVYDLDRCLLQPLAALEPVLAERRESWQLISRLGAAARDRLSTDPPTDLGIGHGDVSLDNILITEAGLTIHDFDLTGIRWRVADLAGVAGTDHLNAFVRGYRTVRDLSDHDLAAVGWLRVVGLIFNLEFHLLRKPLVRGLDSINEGWAEREIEDLARLASDLL